MKLLDELKLHYNIELEIQQNLDNKMTSLMQLWNGNMAQFC